MSVREGIFEYILENIQRICQPRPIANGHVRPSVRHVLIGHLYSMSIIYDNPAYGYDLYCHDIQLWFQSHYKIMLLSCTL
jgi:hypothetical protein